MENKSDASQTAKKPVSNWTLLAIGISAGVIASTFPRLLPLLSEGDPTVAVSLLTIRFVSVAAIFSVMIGVAMIWLYKGTRAHTKDLFMSALALPAVLSGGINMSSFTSVAENRIGDLNSQAVKLQDALKIQHNIEVRELDLGAATPISFGSRLPFLGIPAAHAQQPHLLEKPKRKSSVEINATALERNYVIMLGSAKERAEIEDKKRKIDTLNIPNVQTYRVGEDYYLLQAERRTKSQALLDAIELKKQHGLSPALIQVK